SRGLVRLGMFQPAYCLLASAADRAQLEALVASGRTPQKTAVRARIVLMLVNRVKPSQVAATLGLSSHAAPPVGAAIPGEGRLRPAGRWHAPAWPRAAVAGADRRRRGDDTAREAGPRDALEYAHDGQSGRDQRSDGPPHLASAWAATAPGRAVQTFSGSI